MLTEFKPLNSNPVNHRGIPIRFQVCHLFYWRVAGSLGKVYDTGDPNLSSTHPQLEPFSECSAVEVDAALRVSPLRMRSV